MKSGQRRHDWMLPSMATVVLDTDVVPHHFGRRIYKRFRVHTKTAIATDKEKCQNKKASQGPTHQAGAAKRFITGSACVECTASWA